MIRVTIFNEFIHEKEMEKVRSIYPKGIHGALADAVSDEDVTVDCITLDDIDRLTKEKLDETDVLIWWAHASHPRVPDEVADNVMYAVQKGMGAIFLHSSHFSKPFKKLMGTPCNLTWREDGDYELVWVSNPAHPITQGIGRFIKLDHEETYGEPFGVPEPDQTIMIGSFEGGEVFRAGCCWQRGYGRVFYFQPGHETFPTFHNPDVIRVLKNAVRWANPVCRTDNLGAPHVKKPLED